jgi:hypothetical protein
LNVSTPRRSLWLFGTFLFAGALGCGSNGPSRVPVVPAKGQISYEGKPIANALVIFHPLKADNNAPKPRAKVENDGSFVVETYDSKDGAPVGDYAVTVEWWLTSGKGDEPPTNRLPARFARPEASGVKVTIREGDNDIPAIQLKK